MSKGPRAARILKTLQSEPPNPAKSEKWLRPSLGSASGRNFELVTFSFSFSERSYARCAHEPQNAQVLGNQKRNFEIHEQNCCLAGRLH